MPRFAPSAPVRVRVSDCLCPDTPHADGDFVTLHPKLTVDGGLAASSAMGRVSANGGDFIANVLKAALPHQIAEWTFLDHETKEPLDINPITVDEALPWTHGGREVAKQAFEIYLDEIMGRTPLASRASTTPTDEPSSITPTATTSVTPGSSSKRRAR